ncbi:MAG TPA: FAD-linked oxidase C-terminal domain-containing protein [Phycisphaeraceae bacterium]
MTATAPSTSNGNLQALQQQWRSRLRGEVSFDPVTRGLHATDASHYQVMPRCVVWPMDEQDAVEAVRLASRHGLPITPRGGATSLSGQTTWNGAVIDCSRHMDQLLELNAQERWARVGPGMIRDQLNKLLAPHRLHFAPDPATGDRATVGGMIGNNSSGTHSILYGKTVDNVLETKVALSDGTVLNLGPADQNQWRHLSQQETREGEIYRGFEQIIAQHRDQILARYPKVMRRVSGYNLDAFTGPKPWNLANLIVGSEGTLGLLLEAKVKLEPLPAATAVCVAHFADVIESLRAVPQILEHRPAAVELLDGPILSEALRNRACAALAASFVQGTPAAVLVVEFFGESPQDAADRAAKLARELESQRIGYAWPIRTEPADQAKVWTVRKLSLGLASNVPGPRKRQAFIEDACVPVESLADYIDQILQLCRQEDAPVTLYGHASVGVIHIEPMLDLHHRSEVEKMMRISRRVFELVKHYGGSWSGEHGDGLVRGPFLREFFGDSVYEAFRQVKQLFDPQGLMNPGKIIDCPPMDQNLRYGPDYRITEVPASFHYRDQGGFARAVEQCNGVGACRKLGAGTMCPSYMATKDEEHVTRGRANALRLAMSGQLGPDALQSDRIHEVLELCLECKACKAECPNAVDMARLKSDVLQMRYDRHGTPLGARLLGNLPQVAPLLAGPMAPLVNWVQNSGPFRWAMHKLAGIDRRRPMPAFARQTLRRWFDRRGPQRSNPDAPRVVLFNDTFTNFMEPGVGRAAVRLLEACGYQVILANAGCCQRTRISKGLLHLARRDGEQTLRRLDEYVREGLPIVVLEPSCASALADDLPDLIGDEALGKRVAAQVRMIDVFLAQQIAAGRLTPRFTSPFKRVLVHGHCHQKALFGTDAMKQVFEQTPGLDVQLIDAGCCGMAGSFGYEHYDLSLKIGEDRLFPAVRSRQEGDGIVACGFSCRHQVRDACGVQARHFVEVIAPPEESAEDPPEDR